MVEENAISDFEDRPLLRSQQTSIGRILLIGAQIDHLISLSLFRIAKIDEEIGFKLFGRISISTRIKQLRELLKSNDNKEKFEQFKVIEDHIKTFSNARNMFAHGVYLGFADGHYGFLVTADPSIIDDDNVAFKIKRFLFDGFKGCEFMGVAIKNDLMTIFGISMLLEGLPYTLSADKPRRQR